MRLPSRKVFWCLKTELDRQHSRAARLRGHAANDDAVAEDHLRVAGEEEIRDGVELELRQLAAAFLARQAADQHLGQRARGLLAQPIRQAAREAVAAREVADDLVL